MQLCLDDDSERNSLKVYTDASSRLIVAGMLNSIGQFSQDLGAVTPGAVVKFTGSFQNGFNFMQLDNLPVVQNPNFVLGGGILRIGRDFTGNAVASTSRRRTQVFTERMPGSYIQVEGDSYGAGSADGTSIAKSIQAVSARRAFYTAVGSSTLTQQRDRVLAHPGFNRNTLVHWDGVPNGYCTLSIDMAKYAAIAATRSAGKFVFLTPLQVPTSASDVNAAAAALRTALLSTYPINCFDAQAFVDGVVDPFQADNTHLKGSVMDQVGQALDVWMAASGL